MASKTSIPRDSIGRGWAVMYSIDQSDRVIKIEVSKFETSKASMRDHLEKIVGQALR